MTESDDKLWYKTARALVKAAIDEKICCGCGVCTITCPNDAIDIVKTDLRKLYIPPKDLR